MTTPIVNLKYLLSDVMWEKVRHLLPPLPRKKKRGRTRMDDRKALNAIVYYLRTGCQWDALPKCLGAKSTVHDRFQFWSQQGFFLACWKQGLLEYDSAVGIDWEWQAMDGCHIVAPHAGEDTGPSYKHRGKSGTNRSILTDGNGIPLALHIAPANCNDSTLAEPTLRSFAIDRPNPEDVIQHLCLDKGYDCVSVDSLVLAFGYISHIRRRGEDALAACYSSIKHKPRRWVVERTHSWLNRFRRLIIRWERTSSHYFSFLALACSFIAFQRAGIFADH